MIELIGLFVAFYLWHGLGVTVGYHRLLAHRTFKCSKLVEYFFVLAGYLSFEGSPIWWATIHRAHHRHVDTALDPHSPRYGLMNSHLGWLARITYPDHIDPDMQSKDLVNDPIYKLLETNGDWRVAHTLSYALNILFRAGLWLAFGWKVALVSLIAGYAVLQIPLMLNVICHIPKLGYKRFACDDDSVNVWWVGILALGEGWHNNHHAFPGSAQTGVGWEFDLSWLVIQAMQKLNLVRNVRVAKQVVKLNDFRNRRRRHFALVATRRAKRNAAIYGAKSLTTVRETA